MNSLEDKIKEAVKDIVDCVEFSGDRTNIVLEEDVLDVLQGLLDESFHYVEPNSCLLELQKEDAYTIFGSEIDEESENPPENYAVICALARLLEEEEFVKLIWSEYAKLVEKEDCDCDECSCEANTA